MKFYPAETAEEALKMAFEDKEGNYTTGQRKALKSLIESTSPNRYITFGLGGRYWLASPYSKFIFITHLHAQGYTVGVMNRKVTGGLKNESLS